MSSGSSSSPRSGSRRPSSRAKIRPWGSVWRVVAGGRVYFAKQNCPGQAHEAGLLSALTRIAPEYVVPVVAADPGRDLLLTRDLGRTLAERGADHDVDTWCRIVRDAALLQRAVAPQRGRSRADPDAARVRRRRTSATRSAGSARCLPVTRAGCRRTSPSGCGPCCRRSSAGRTRWPSWTCRSPSTTTTCTRATWSPRRAPMSRCASSTSATPSLTEPLGALLIPLNVSARRARRRSGRPAAAPDRRRSARGVDRSGARTRAPQRPCRQRSSSARLARVESWRRCVVTMTAEERAEFGSAPADWLGTLDLGSAGATHGHRCDASGSAWRYWIVRWRGRGRGGRGGPCGCSERYGWRERRARGDPAALGARLGLSGFRGASGAGCALPRRTGGKRALRSHEPPQGASAASSTRSRR